MVDKNRYRQLLAMALLVLAASGQRGRRRTPDAFRRAIRTILLIETAVAWEGAVSRTGDTQPLDHRPLHRASERIRKTDRVAPYRKLYRVFDHGRSGFVRSDGNRGSIRQEQPIGDSNRVQ